MLWSAQEMSKKFRMALGKNVSTRAIHVFAEKLGYHMKRIGGKKGYDQSLYTALTRHLKELLDYDRQQINKSPQKAQKQPNLGDYYTYNGERDNVDYDWEKNECMKHRKDLINEGVEKINNLNYAIEGIIKKQWSSPDDYWYVSISQRQKDNSNVTDDNGMSIFSGRIKKTKDGQSVENVGWEDGDSSQNKIGYVVVKGNTVDEAIDSLANPTVTIFESWRYFFDGKKQISSNDGQMGSIIEICRMFNARAYFSSYKRSYGKYNGFDPKDTNVTKPIISLRGKTDPISRERVFDFVSTRKFPFNQHKPVWFVDCDDENKEINSKVVSGIKKICGVDPKIYETHNGVHYIIDMSQYYTNKKGIKVAWGILNTLKQFLYDLYGNKIEKRKKDTPKQPNPIEIDMGYSIILFSEVKMGGKNIASPEWQKIKKYPVPDLRNVKLAVHESLEQFLRKEFNIQ